MAKEKIYPYAVARIRVLEKNLLTKQTLFSMVDARSVSDCLRTLSEFGYQGALETEAYDFENLLSKELEKSYQLIEELVPEENFLDVFLYKKDYHNLKVMIKSEVARIDGKQNLVSGGTISVEKLAESLQERNYRELPEVMGKAIFDAFDVYAKTGNGQAIDIILDKATFMQMKETAFETENDFVIGYVQKLADLTNLKSYLRTRMMKKDYTFLKDVFVTGGKVAESTFFAAFSMEDAIGVFQGTDYGTLCEESMEKGFTVFEKHCDDFMMEYIKSAKYKSLTLEPLIAYLYAKEAEVKTVRIILTSKLNKIEESIIKERVREAYV